MSKKLIGIFEISYDLLNEFLLRNNGISIFVFIEGSNYKIDFFCTSEDSVRNKLVIIKFNDFVNQTFDFNSFNDCSLDIDYDFENDCFYSRALSKVKAEAINAKLTFLNLINSDAKFNSKIQKVFYKLQPRIIKSNYKK